MATVVSVPLAGAVRGRAARQAGVVGPAPRSALTRNAQVNCGTSFSNEEWMQMQAWLSFAPAAATAVVPGPGRPSRVPRRRFADARFR